MEFEELASAIEKGVRQHPEFRECASFADWCTGNQSWITVSDADYETLRAGLEERSRICGLRGVCGGVRLLGVPVYPGSPAGVCEFHPQGSPNPPWIINVEQFTMVRRWEDGPDGEPKLVSSKVYGPR